MQKLIIKIDFPAYGGAFIGRHEGKVVMISGETLPKETVEVTVESDKKDYLKASVSSIIEPSPLRISPECRYYQQCGGCHLQHTSYNNQVKIKKGILKDCLKRIAKTEPDLSESLTAKSPWNYRCRAQLKVSDKGIGFYRRNSRDVIEIDHCPLMSDEVNICMNSLRKLQKEAELKELHITCGDRPVAMLIPADTKKPAYELNKLASGYMDAGLSGLSILTSDNHVLNYGRAYTVLEFDSMQYTISPISFLQSNWALNKAVINILKNSLGPLRGKKVLDLYAGAGNFSLPLAADAEVVAVEGNPHAITDGRRNIEINNIKNCRIICSAAEGFSYKDRFDIVILDPPRPGLSNKVVERVLEMEPEKIVYISCNPATFSRDLKKLLKKYILASIRMTDFFPQTFHIESLAFLELR